MFLIHVVLSLCGLKIYNIKKYTALKINTIDITMKKKAKVLITFNVSKSHTFYHGWYTFACDHLVLDDSYCVKQLLILSN